MITACVVPRNNTINSTIKNKLTVASVYVGIIVHVDLTAHAVKIISQLDVDVLKAANVVMIVLVEQIVDVVLNFYPMINVYVNKDAYVEQTANAHLDAVAVPKIK